MEVQRKIHEEIVKSSNKNNKVETELSCQNMDQNKEVINLETAKSSEKNRENEQQPKEDSTKNDATIEKRKIVSIKKTPSMTLKKQTDSPKLIEYMNNQFLTYANVKWSLNLRKEVFSPCEKLENPSAIDLIFMQIIHDFNSNNCIRISEIDRQKLIDFLAEKGLTVAFLFEQYKSFKMKFKMQLIDIAKDVWPLYFCRLFPAEDLNHVFPVQMLGVSHSMIRLINREPSSVNENLVPIEEFRFEF